MEYQFLQATLLKAFINKEKAYVCDCVCDRCVYKDITGMVQGCNPQALKDTVDRFIKENIPN